MTQRVTDPAFIQVFSAYKAALAAALSPHLSASVRGMALLLMTREQIASIVCFYEGDESPDTEPLAAALLERAAALPAQFGFTGYRTTLRFARCDPPAPLVYEGCPIWGRAGTTWALPPEIAARLAAQAG